MGALLISQEVSQSIFSCWLLVINIYRQAGISKYGAMEVQEFYSTTFENILLSKFVAWSIVFGSRNDWQSLPGAEKIFSSWQQK